MPNAIMSRPLTLLAGLLLLTLLGGLGVVVINLFAPRIEDGQGLGPESSVLETALPALTLDTLKNADYGKCGGKLTDGKARYLTDLRGSIPLTDAKAAVIDPSHITVTELVGPVAFGDLNGDGVNDAAAVFLTQTPGTTGRFYSLVTVRNADGSPEHVACVFLGDRVRIGDLAIEHGAIRVGMIGHRPIADPQFEGLCCPNLPMIVLYVLDEQSLIEQERVFPAEIFGLN